MINIHHIKTLRTQEVRIAQLQELDRAKLVRSVPALMKMVGCDVSSTTDEEGFELVMKTFESVLTTSFGMNLTPGEFMYAFQLYISGDVEVKKEFQHFGQFNLKFISELLNDYTSKRNKLLQTMPQQVAPVEKQLSSKHAFDECMETYTSMIEELGKSSKLQEFGNFDFSYLFLEVIGEIKLTEEDKTEHIGYVRQIISQEADTLQSVELRKEYRGRFQKSPEAFKTKCRDEYFKRWVNEKLTDFITDTGDIDKAELKAWCEIEVQRINELNRIGEFNKYRK